MRIRHWCGSILDKASPSFDSLLEQRTFSWCSKSISSHRSSTFAFTVHFIEFLTAISKEMFGSKVNTNLWLMRQSERQIIRLFLFLPSFYLLYLDWLTQAPPLLIYTWRLSTLFSTQVHFRMLLHFLFTHRFWSSCAFFVEGNGAKASFYPLCIMSFLRHIILVIRAMDCFQLAYLSGIFHRSINSDAINKRRDRNQSHAQIDIPWDTAKIHPKIID